MSRGEAFRRGARRHPLIIGHRGVRGPVPENTMAAFARALEEGSDGIELDVRTTRDGEVVVFHDDDCRRMTLGFDSRRVDDLTAKELRRVDLGNGERAPLLDEVLDWLEPTALLVNVEVKREVASRPRAVMAVARILARRRKLRDRVLISSFDPLMLAAFNPLLPRVPLGFLFYSEQLSLHPWELARFGPWDAAHPEHVMIHSALENVSGRIVNTWTVNDPDRAVALARAGVDGIITDRPAAIRAAVAGTALALT